MNNQTTDVSLLNEIFMTPAVQTVEQRFETITAAPCNGKCVSGTCRGSALTDINYNSLEFYAQ